MVSCVRRQAAVCAKGWPLVWIALLQAAAVAVFLHGFLLTRQELAQHSTCSASPLRQPVVDSGSVQHCWASAPGSDGVAMSTARYSKLVLLVVDALRHDFVSPQDDAACDDDSCPPWYNQLPTVQRLLRDESDRARLYLAQADPPTVTQQRLKAMMGGGVPTFVDASDNFASPAISEDNLLQQAADANMSVTFIGDDTWTRLFPDTFARAYPFPSFDVADLDTVDAGVAALLPLELQGRVADAAKVYDSMTAEAAPVGRDTTPSDIVVAHMLGVDHTGHTHGSMHPTMGRKLREVDEVVQSVLPLLAPDTLLVIMGDHGMTRDGNHGGATAPETATAAFFYSPHAPLTAFPRPAECSRADATVPLAHCNDVHAPGFMPTRPVHQVDLVPTLAFLLGLPTPFGSIGVALPDLLYAPVDADVSPAASQKGSAAVATANVAQIARYLAAYDGATGGVFSTGSAEAAYAALRARGEGIVGGGGDGDVGDVLEAAAKWAREATDLCRKHWTQFDVTAMVAGAGLLAVTTVLALLLGMRWLPHQCAQGAVLSRDRQLIGDDTDASADTPPSDMYHWLFRLVHVRLTGASSVTLSLLHAIITLGALVAPIAYGVVVTGTPVVATLPVAAVVSTTTFIATSFAVASLGTRSWSFPSLPRRLAAITLPDAVAVVAVVMRVAALFSNSYMDAEPLMLHCLTATLLIAIGWHAMRSRLLTTLASARHVVTALTPIAVATIIALASSRAAAAYSATHVATFGRLPASDAVSAGTTMLPAVGLVTTGWLAIGAHQRHQLRRVCSTAFLTAMLPMLPPLCATVSVVATQLYWFMAVARDRAAVPWAPDSGAAQSLTLLPRVALAAFAAAVALLLFLCPSFRPTSDAELEAAAKRANDARANAAQQAAAAAAASMPGAELPQVQMSSRPARWSVLPVGGAGQPLITVAVDQSGQLVTFGGGVADGAMSGLMISGATLPNVAETEASASCFLERRRLTAASSITNWLQACIPQLDDGQLCMLCNAASAWLVLLSGAAIALGPASPALLAIGTLHVTSALYVVRAYVVGLTSNALRSAKKAASRVPTSTSPWVAFRATGWSAPPCAIVLFALLAWQYFYASGHGCAFNKLHFSAAFVGFARFSFWRGLVMVVWDAAWSHIAIAVALPAIFALVPYVPARSDATPMRGGILAALRVDISRLGVAGADRLTQMYTLFVAVALCAPCTAIAVFVIYARRHLMVWALFAPKLVFEFGVALLVQATVLCALPWWFRAAATASSWTPEQYFVVEASATPDGAQSSTSAPISSARLGAAAAAFAPTPHPLQRRAAAVAATANAPPARRRVKRSARA